MSGSPQGTPVAGASRGAFAAEILRGGVFPTYSHGRAELAMLWWQAAELSAETA